ncbi:MAG: peptidase [Chloroflexi bacterium]|nr:peptidase [Chloroflexota bacterium]
MDIPLFPLHAVLCPGVVLPLHVFETRYRTLVERCLEDGSGFGVVRIREGREVGDGPVALEQVGTIARLRDVTRLPDGRFELTVVGVERFRLASVATDRAPYLVADGVLLGEPLGDPARIPGLVAAVMRRLGRYLAAVAPATVPSDDPSYDEISGGLAAIEDPAALSHLVAGMLPMEPAVRQRLLEAPTAEARLADLERVLSHETGLLERRLAAWPGDPRGSAGRNN